MVHKSRIIQAVSLVAALAVALGTMHADEIKLTDPALKEAVSEYNSAVEEARKKFLPNFDKTIGLVRNNKSLSPEEAAKAISELETYQAGFLTDGSIPLNPVLIKLAQPYGRETDRAALKVSNVFQKAAKVKLSEGKVDEATALLKYRDQLIVGEGFEIVGHWCLAEGIGAHGYSEQYLIQKRLGQWSVERSFYEPSGKKVGESKSRDLKFTGDVLNYTDHFTRKPKAEWHDKAEMKIWADRENAPSIKLRWTVTSGQTDQITLVPVK